MCHSCALHLPSVMSLLRCRNDEEIEAFLALIDHRSLGKTKRFNFHNFLFRSTANCLRRTHRRRTSASISIWAAVPCSLLCVCPHGCIFFAHSRSEVSFALPHCVWAAWASPLAACPKCTASRTFRATATMGQHSRTRSRARQHLTLRDTYL